MSATHAQTVPHRQQVPPGRSERFTVVDSRAARRSKPRILYAGIAVATLLLVVVAQLLLSIGVSQGAYELGSLHDTKTTLARQLQAVTEQVDTLSSPQNLAANANALGMVSNGTPVYLRLSDSAVLGSPTAASAAAGTVTGASGNLVPNSLLQGVPLITQKAGQPSVDGSATAVNSATTPGANALEKPKGPVALNGALPSPTTH